MELGGPSIPLGRNLATLKVVRIGRPVSRSWWRWVGDQVAAALVPAVDRIQLVQYELPDFDRIEASLLTASLAEEVGGHVLAITGADLTAREERSAWGYMFGGKDNRNDVAVVSTRRLGGDGSELRHRRLLGVALHELGHNFGLGHHYFFAPGESGDCCPMSKGDYNRYGERGYVRAVIDARGASFCRPCRLFLRRMYSS